MRNEPYEDIERGLLTVSALCLLSASAAAQSVVVDGVGADERAALIDASRTAVEQVADVDVDAGFEEEFLLVPLTAEFYLDYEGEGIAVKPVFVYDHIRFNPVVQAVPEADARHLLVRDAEAEQAVLAVFARYGFTKKRDQFVQLDEERSYDFLTQGLEELPERVEIFYEASFERRPVRPMPRMPGASRMLPSSSA